AGGILQVQVEGLQRVAAEQGLTVIIIIISLHPQAVRIAQPVGPAGKQIAAVIAVAGQVADLIVENVALQRELVRLAAEIGAKPGLPAAEAVVEDRPDTGPGQILAVEIMAVDPDRAAIAERKAIAAADIAVIGPGRTAHETAPSVARTARRDAAH